MALPRVKIDWEVQTKNAKADLADLGEEMRDTGREAEAAGKDVDRLEEKIDHLGRTSDKTAPKVEAVAVDADRLGDEAAAAAPKVERLGRATQKAGSKTTPFGRGLQNASYQLGDFAVQVGAGTSASIALGQQLPQLLGGFGIMGAVLGAVVAIAVPLSRAFKNMAESGKDLGSVLGVLRPIFSSIGEAFSYIGKAAIEAAEAIINNLDRIIITATTAAVVIGGKFVVAWVAAKVAIIATTIAAINFRKALIRTGLGVFIVLLGEVVYRFLQLKQAAGGYGEAIGLVGDIFSEVWQRMSEGISLMGDLWSGLGTTIKGYMFIAFGAIEDKIRSVLNVIIEGINAVKDGLRAAGAEDLAGDNISLLGGPGVGEKGEDLVRQGRGIMGGATSGMGDLLSKPLKSIKAIRDVLKNIKDERIDLPSLLGSVGSGKGDEDGQPKKDQPEKDLGTYLNGMVRNPAWDALIKRLSDVRKAHEMVASQGRQTWSSLGNLVQQFAGKSKAAAIAAIAIQKGLAIAQILVNTAAAEMRALAELGPIAGPPAAASIRAWGMANAALVAATGLAQMSSSVGGGGSRGGASSSPILGGQSSTAGSIEPSASGSRGPAVSLTLVGNSGFTRAQIVQIAEALNDSGDEGALVDIRGRR